MSQRTTSVPRPCVAYLRPPAALPQDSSEWQHEQRDALLTFAAQHGYTVSTWVIEHRLSPQRLGPAFRRVLQTALKQAAGVVLVYKLPHGPMSSRYTAALDALANAGFIVHILKGDGATEVRDGRAAQPAPRRPRWTRSRNSCKVTPMRMTFAFDYDTMRQQLHDALCATGAVPSNDPTLADMLAAATGQAIHNADIIDMLRSETSPGEMLVRLRELYAERDSYFGSAAERVEPALRLSLFTLEASIKAHRRKRPAA